LSQAMLILVDVKDLVGLVKGLQNESAQVISVLSASKPITASVEQKAIEPGSLPVGLPERFCCECGEYFEPDDMVVEYFVDDGSDEFKIWYHKACMPNMQDLAIYRSAKKIREIRASDFDKQVQTEQAEVTLEPRKRNKGIKDAVLKLLEDHPEGLATSAIYKSSGSLGVKRESIGTALWVLKKRGKVVAEGHPVTYRLKGEVGDE
jgi:hypothetical protein